MSQSRIKTEDCSRNKKSSKERKESTAEQDEAPIFLRNPPVLIDLVSDEEVDNKEADERVGLPIEVGNIEIEAPEKIVSVPEEDAGSSNLHIKNLSEAEAQDLLQLLDIEEDLAQIHGEDSVNDLAEKYLESLTSNQTLEQSQQAFNQSSPSYPPVLEVNCSCFPRTNNATEPHVLGFPNPLPADLNKWSVEEVIQFIQNNGIDMTQHAKVFRYHEIDGKAMCILNVDMMIKIMGLTLGVSLKIEDMFRKVQQ